MADHTITVANSLNLLGLGPPSLWGEDWHELYWGYGSATFPFEVTHIYDNSLTPDTTMSFDATRFIEETISTSDLTSKDQYIDLFEGLSLDFETTDESLKDGAGYTYVYPSDATNLEDRDYPTYTSQAANASTYTSAAVGSTTWS